MLEGEIQAMYMCKPGEGEGWEDPGDREGGKRRPVGRSCLLCSSPAIERAMAFLDTGELPWGMDLFNERKERQVSYGRAQGTCSCSTVTHTYRGCDGS